MLFKSFKKKIVTGHTLGVFILSIYRQRDLTFQAKAFRQRKTLGSNVYPVANTFIYNYSISVTANIN